MSWAAGLRGRSVMLVTTSRALPPRAPCAAWHLSAMFSGCSVLVQSVAEKSGGGWGSCTL